MEHPSLPPSLPPPPRPPPRPLTAPPCACATASSPAPYPFAAAPARRPPPPLRAPLSERRRTHQTTWADLAPRLADDYGTPEWFRRQRQRPRRCVAKAAAIDRKLRSGGDLRAPPPHCTFARDDHLNELTGATGKEA